MQIRFFNKNNQHKRFEFTPRYYDERKERLELKKAEYDKIANQNLSPEERRNLLRQQMKENWSRAQGSEKQRSSSNIRILILILILLALGYFIFNGLDDVDVVVKKLM